MGGATGETKYHRKILSSLQKSNINVLQEVDPFWEAEDHDVLIGHAHVYMQSLSYMVILYRLCIKVTTWQPHGHGSCTGIYVY